MENLLGLLHSMLRSLPATSDARVRLLAKFVEKDYEKISLIVAHRSLVAENWASSKRKTRNEWEQLSLEEQEARGVEEWLTAQMGERNFSLEVNAYFLDTSLLSSLLVKNKCHQGTDIFN